MGNVLKRNRARAVDPHHLLSYGVYRKKSKSFSKPIEPEVRNMKKENQDLDATDSWTSTIGTRSAFSLSLPTGESERSIIEKSSKGCDVSSADGSRTSSTTSGATSSTSADFSSFRNLSEISEHTTMRPRADDLEWMEAVRQYHDREPVFRKKPFKATLRIRSRKVFPRLSWRYLYHQWAIRQVPKTYRGKDVWNPYIDTAMRGENGDIDMNLSDLEHGIFYLKCTNC